ncbi:hypothetical protein [Aliiroseovarius sp. 2305UL8-7]|uniref:hypothetical protein n=1 Tax=Aliiroseovarius conchicola TaxID=3121637 RepID=UPI003529338D
MLSSLTKLAMVASFAVFAGFAIDDWAGQMLGWHNNLWHILELPDQSAPPPFYLVVLGALVTLVGLIGLAMSFLAIWKILSDGQQQDFRRLARRLQTMAYGFIAFWLSNYLLFGGVRTLMARYISDPESVVILWDPFNPDLVFAITAVALLAIANMMERAWQAEDETQHFL